MPKTLDLPIDEICDYYESGMPSSEIAVLYGCHSRTILSRLHQNGIEVRSNSECHRGEKNHFYGKTHTDETKQLIRDNHADMSGKNNPMYGRTGEDAPCYGRTGELHPMFGKRGAEVGFFGHHHTEANKRKSSERMIGKHVGDKSPRWKGGFDRRRPYLLPKYMCIQLNSHFDGSDFHHLSKSIGVYMPTELHKHVYHDVKHGENLGVMNMLALQFINGGYDG